MFFSDCQERDNAEYRGLMDVYVAGPPCQPFSLLLNPQNALSDPRAAVFLAILQTIASVRPNIFVIENVAALLERNTEFTAEVLLFLQNLKDSVGRPTYDVDLRIVDSLDNGLPQRRRRLYIVGGKKQKNTWHAI